MGLARVVLLDEQEVAFQGEHGGQSAADVHGSVGQQFGGHQSDPDVQVFVVGFPGPDGLDDPVRAARTASGVGAIWKRA
ncbi:hypothetical protein [Streptomyces sp. Caat 7-52]|uniref:hypothetical protein n=1 Tax=Streptomyces sp. Caat 7-52 TaxID=2949637 RepID=UPI00203538FE|nr:hypothetical protein [Streptomyces sp. Caat 7-52]